MRNQRTLVEKILAGLEIGGATVEIIREGQAQEVIIQPIVEEFFIEEYETDDYFEGPELIPADSTNQQTEQPDEEPDEDF